MLGIKQMFQEQKEKLLEGVVKELEKRKNWDV
jgi:hypothetical protein